MARTVIEFLYCRRVRIALLAILLPLVILGDRYRGWYAPHGAAIAVSPDGQRTASAFRFRRRVGAYVGYIDVRALDGNSRDLLIRLPSALGALTFGPAKDELTVGLEDGTVQIWDLPTGRVRQTYTITNPPLVQLVPCGSKLLAGTANGNLFVLVDPESGAMADSVKTSPSRAVAKDNRIALTKLYDEERIGLFEVAEGQLRQTGVMRKAHGPASLSSDGNRLAVVVGHSRIEVWDFERGKTVARLPLDFTGMRFGPHVLEAMPILSKIIAARGRAADLSAARRTDGTDVADHRLGRCAEQESNSHRAARVFQPDCIHEWRAGSGGSSWQPNLRVGYRVRAASPQLRSQPARTSDRLPFATSDSRLVRTVGDRRLATRQVTLSRQPGSARDRRTRAAGCRAPPDDRPQQRHEQHDDTGRTRQLPRGLRYSGCAQPSSLVTPVNCRPFRVGRPMGRLGLSHVSSFERFSAADGLDDRSWVLGPGDGGVTFLAIPRTATWTPNLPPTVWPAITSRCET